MKVALIFDKLLRTDTTGTYCAPALRSLGHEVVYYAPLCMTPENQFSFNTYQFLDPQCDLYLQIDDDLSYPGPTQFKPNAYWCIDVHRFNSMVGGWTRAEKAMGFQKIFSAQQDGVTTFKRLGFTDVTWLPLAFDPTAHYRIERAQKKFDWCFIGNLNKVREDYLHLLEQKWPNCYIGKAYGKEMVALYNQAKLLFNYSIKNDINMRIFEAMGCGGLLVTNRLDNGEDELFQNTLLTYRDREELLSLFNTYLSNDRLRSEMAERQYQCVIKNHTYAHRMNTLISEVVKSGRTE